MDKRKEHAALTPAIIEEILDGIRAGVPMAQQVVLNAERLDFPTESAFRKRLAADNALFADYTRAREIGADAMADETISISDGDLNPQRAANRIKARQWHASRMKPKVYGDKLDIDLKGTIDVQAAILAARRRSQGIDNTQLIDVTTTDKISDVVIDQPAEIDPFS